MAKLSKAEIAAHRKAMDLVHSDKPLSESERDFILDNWNESANHINSAAGAHFTPAGLARDFCMEIDANARVLDLCAGIGALSYPLYARAQWDRRRALDLTCVEINPDYVAVGRRVAPWANWICASVDDVLGLGLGRFDYVVSNPPFGTVAKVARKGLYSGSAFEFHVIELGAHLASYGVFLVPQMSAPFELSGKRSYTPKTAGKAHDFTAQTGIVLQANCGLDTAIYRGDWKTTNIVTEIVCVDYVETPLRGGMEIAA